MYGSGDEVSSVNRFSYPPPLNILIVEVEKVEKKKMLVENVKKEEINWSVEREKKNRGRRRSWRQWSRS